MNKYASMLTAICLAVCLLFSACGNPAAEGDTSATHVEPATGTASDPAKDPEPETDNPRPTLMERRQPVGQPGNAWYIPHDEIEEIAGASLCLFKDSILVYGSASDSETENRFVIKRIRLADGALLAECLFPCGSFITLQTGRDAVGICDPEGGIIRLFDENLRETASFRMRIGGASWYLNRAMDRVYMIDWQHGITSADLTSGDARDELSNVTNVCVRSSTQDQLFLSYIDKTTQKYAGCILHLTNGETEALPQNGDFSFGARVRNTWLIGTGNSGEYRLTANGTIKNMVWQENRVDLLAPQEQILTVNADGNTLCLYNIQGHFLSRCTLPGEGVYAGNTQVWSDLWTGYFFLMFENDTHGKLIFWDTESPLTGEDLLLTDDAPRRGSSADPVLYERAAALGEEYGFELLIADQCGLDYIYYTAAEIADSNPIQEALDTLKRVFGSYPAGFFGQLTYGNVQKLQIELVSCLAPTAEAASSNAIAAFAQELPDRYLLVFDVYGLSERVVFHELTHLLDNRLAWDASLRENALFSEAAWQALNPEGFDYGYTYIDLPASVLAFADSGCFASDYAMTYPTEDRATMMETALTDPNLPKDYYTGLLVKLDYYSRCIRDCLDTAGWPETTAWESLLR